MDAARRKRLEKAGWRVGTVAEFLNLTPAESALIDMHLSLSKKLREQRVHAGMSQSELAKRVGSSQSRIAKMEASDASVTLDLMIRSLLELGVSSKDIARAIAS